MDNGRSVFDGRGVEATVSEGVNWAGGSAANQSRRDAGGTDRAQAVDARVDLGGSVCDGNDAVPPGRESEEAVILTGNGWFGSIVMDGEREPVVLDQIKTYPVCDLWLLLE